MPALFLNRTEAGRQLAAKLTDLRGQPEVVVLGLPRGGVPVAHEVARGLGAPLDVFVVRKIGVPGEPELAMGAVASGGARVVNTEVVRMLGIERRVFDQVTEVEQRELARREQRYRQGRPFPSLLGATVVLVDDGVATGSTMRAAVLALRHHEPAAIVAAAPVMSLSARAALEKVADRCVFVATPEPFYGVAAWYQDFTQTTDEEVDAVLAESGTTPPNPALAGNPV
jgi:predicted phosphoribosyltransferase